MERDIRRPDDIEHQQQEEQYQTHQHIRGTHHHVVAAFKRISWGAVFAGVFVSLMSMLILNMLGIGIGAGAVNPYDYANPMAGIGTGAAIWWFASLIISVFAGGYVAGRMSGMPRTPNGLLHGLVMYSFFTIALFYIVTSAAGSIISGAGSLLSRMITIPGQNLANLGRNMTDAQIRDAANIAAHNLSTAALWIFFGLVIGGIAAAIGGRLGEPKPLVITSRHPVTERHDLP